VIEIDGASHRGIDDIRALSETVGYIPSSGAYRIYIIDEVHMLTKEAFNALLKTLEEPPPHVKFFFATTEPHKVLPTILSRCQRFDLRRIPLESLRDKLKWIAQDLGVAYEEEALALIAHVAEGSLRDAESLFDQVLCYTGSPVTLEQVSATLGLVPHDALRALDTAYAEHNLSYPFALTNTLFASGRDWGQFLDQLTDHYRSLLKMCLGGASDAPTDALKAYYEQAKALYTQEQCLLILELLTEAAQELPKTPFKRVHLELLLLRILRAKYRVSLPALVKRLQELEHMVAPPAPPPPVSLPPAPPFPGGPTSPPPPLPLPNLPTQGSNQYDTLLRFAAVELEGSLSK
jgi:DNA polymerase-3 subunit gamma/tau